METGKAGNISWLLFSLHGGSEGICGPATKYQTNTAQGVVYLILVPGSRHRAPKIHAFVGCLGGIVVWASNSVSAQVPSQEFRSSAQESA